MPRAALLIAACSLPLSLAAAADAQIFRRAIGFQSSECAYCVENCTPASGGGFITVGRLNPATTANRDIYLVRYASTGVDSWTRVISSINGMDDVGFSVRQTSDGGFIVASETRYIAGLGMMLTRVSPVGGVTWSRAYAGTPFEDFPSGTKVREHADGTATVVGRHRPGALLQGRIVRANLAGGGVPVWSYNYVLPGIEADVSFTDLRTLPAAAGAEGYIVSGWIKELTAPQRSALIVRLDALGNPLVAWSYSIPGRSLTADGLTISNGEVVFSGRISASPTATATETVIARVNPGTGNVAWARLERDFRNGFAAVATDIGGVIVAGTEPTSDAIALVRLNAAGGGLIFANSHRADGEGHDVIAMPGLGAGYAVTGFDTLAPSNGIEDVALLKTNAGGSPGCLVTPKPGPIAIQLERVQRPVQRITNFENVTMPANVSMPDSGNIVRCTTPFPIPCPADWTLDLVLDSRDFFAFIRDFFELNADINEDDATNSQDFFEYLRAFFAGC